MRCTDEVLPVVPTAPYLEMPLSVKSDICNLNRVINIVMKVEMYASKSVMTNFKAFNIGETL